MAETACLWTCCPYPARVDRTDWLSGQPTRGPSSDLERASTGKALSEGWVVLIGRYRPTAPPVPERTVPLVPVVTPVVPPPVVTPVVVLVPVVAPAVPVVVVRL